MSKELWLQAALWLKDLGVIDVKNSCFAKGARVYHLVLALQDGVVLCNLANRLVPSTVDSIHINPAKQFLKMQNINVFLEVIPKMGVKTKNLFTADELYYASNFPRVIQCLSAVSESKSARSAGFPKFPAGAEAAPNTATGAGGEDMYQSLEDLIRQSISFAEASTGSNAFLVGDDDEGGDVYGSIMQVITSGDGDVDLDGDAYAEMVGVATDFEVHEEECATGPDTRLRILAELEDSELRYVSVLHVIVDEFMMPLKGSNGFQEGVHKSIFSNVADLLTLHTEFHGMIKAQMASSSGCQLSVPFLTCIHKMHIYSQFCCDIPEAMAILKRCLKKKSTAAILDKLKAQSGQRFSLKSLLNVPVQRVLKYPLLLKELIKSTNEGHNDRPKLINAKAAMTNLLTMINAKQSEQGMLSAIAAALIDYKGPPLEQYAPFVKDGYVMYKDCKSSKKHENRLNIRYAFMLQPVIVLTQPHKAKYKYKSLCKLEPTMKVASVEFWKLPKDDQNSKFSFAWCLKVGAEERYIFAAKTMLLKKKWMMQMTRLIEDLGVGPAPSVAEHTSTAKPNDNLMFLVGGGGGGGGSGGGEPKGGAAAPPPIVLNPPSQGYEEWTPNTIGSTADPEELVRMPFTEEEWFAGKLGRSKAEKLFVDTADGTFLVRETDRPPGGDYSLSVKYCNVIKHFRINRKGNMYDLAPDAKAFLSIEEMVEHYRTHSLNRHFPGTETTLVISIKDARALSRASTPGNARSKFSYTARSPEELAFERGVELTILSTDDSTLDPGWWMGTLPNGQVGKLPSNYVELFAPPCHGRTGTAGGGDTGPGVGRARSKFAYTARALDELTFERGVELTILSTDDSTLDPGWWMGTLPNGQVGKLPSNYVQLLGKLRGRSILPCYGKTLIQNLSMFIFIKLIGCVDSDVNNHQSTDENVARATHAAVRFQEYQPDQSKFAAAVPLSVRLQPIKNILDEAFQKQLQSAPISHYSCNFTPYVQMNLDPVIQLICDALSTMMDSVIKSPDYYRVLLVSMSKEDRTIYDAQFNKTINPDVEGGDLAAYNSMLKKSAVFQSENFVEMTNVNQPTTDLITLVLMVREYVPAYKTAIESVVAQAKQAAGATAAAAALLATPINDFSAIVIYRLHDQTKSPYRMIEKSLTKGPNRDYPDCSKVFDVFGCIINCIDYISMAAVVEAFADQHHKGELQICRFKDRWTKPSSGGWRDFMINLVIKGVVFEVQIVLKSMLAARKGMDGHKTYNQFRSFMEIFDMLDLGLAVTPATADDGSDEVVHEGQPNLAAKGGRRSLIDLQAENQLLMAALMRRGAADAPLSQGPQGGVPYDWAPVPEKGGGGGVSSVAITNVGIRPPTAALIAPPSLCECEEDIATMFCGICGKKLCDDCDAAAHAKGTKKSHNRVPIKAHLHNSAISASKAKVDSAMLDTSDTVVVNTVVDAGSQSEASTDMAEISTKQIAPTIKSSTPIKSTVEVAPTVYVLPLPDVISEAKSRKHSGDEHTKTAAEIETATVETVVGVEVEVKEAEKAVKVTIGPQALRPSPHKLHEVRKAPLPPAEAGLAMKVLPAALRMTDSASGSSGSAITTAAVPPAAPTIASPPPPLPIAPAPDIEKAAAYFVVRPTPSHNSSATPYTNATLEQLEYDSEDSEDSDGSDDLTYADAVEVEC